MNTTTKPTKQVKLKRNARKAPGPKPNPAVSQIQKQMAVSKRRAQQLVREAETAEGGAKTLIELKIRRQRQIIEKGEIELERMRSGTEQTVPIRKLKESFKCFLRAAQVALSQGAERLCTRDSGNPEQFRDFQRFANGSYYGSLGTMMSHADERIKVVVSEVLEAGDVCFRRGPEAEETAAHNAAIFALTTLAKQSEGPHGSPAQVEAVLQLAKCFGISPEKS